MVVVARSCCCMSWLGGSGSNGSGKVTSTPHPQPRGNYGRLEARRSAGQNCVWP